MPNKSPEHVLNIYREAEWLPPSSRKVTSWAGSLAASAIVLANPGFRSTRRSRPSLHPGPRAEAGKAFNIKWVAQIGAIFLVLWEQTPPLRSPCKQGRPPPIDHPLRFGGDKQLGHNRHGHTSTIEPLTVNHRIYSFAPAKVHIDATFTRRSMLARHPPARWPILEHCEATGVSPRTLFYAFNDLLDLSPHAYTKRVRLQAARRMIVDNCDRRCVQRVARELEFAHEGQFAIDYASVFGESPSKTRKRIIVTYGSCDEKVSHKIHLSGGRGWAARTGRGLFFRSFTFLRSSVGLSRKAGRGRMN